MGPKNGVDGYSGDKSEFDYAISHDEWLWWGGQEETGNRVDVEPLKFFDIYCPGAWQPPVTAPTEKFRKIMINPVSCTRLCTQFVCRFTTDLQDVRLTFQCLSSNLRS